MRTAAISSAVSLGPEGGITEEELQTLGGTPVRLGPSVLRASSAGAVAAAAYFLTHAIVG